MWSEEQIVFDKNICRFCGVTSKKLLNFPYDDVSDEGNSVWQLIKRLVPLKINSLDRKPQQVCYECIETLEKYDALISTCLANDSNFDNVLKIVGSAQNGSDAESKAISQGGKRKSESHDSENIILMNKIKGHSDSQNDGFYIIVELNCKRINIDNFVLKYNDNKTCRENEVESETGDSKENAGTEKVQIPNITKTDNKVKPFKCSICEKSMTRKSNLVSHLALHSEERPYKCNECGKTFAIFTDLTLHRHIHSQSYACKICKKCFVTKSKLERHEKSHTGIKDYACPVCKKKFAEKNNMINHISIHTGVKPFSCSVCKKSFRTQSHLTDHGKVHSAESPFKCVSCSKSFKWKSNLKDHMKFHSGEKFKCPDCDSEFNNRSDYYKHRKKCRELKNQQLTKTKLLIS